MRSATTAWACPALLLVLIAAPAVGEPPSRDIAPIIAKKCDACHGRGASRLHAMLFSGTIRWAQRDWDVSDGYPFGGDYAADPVLQLSMLEVAVATRSMPPRAYGAARPQRRLSDDEVRRMLRWIQQTRTAYRRAAPAGNPRM